MIRYLYASSRAALFTIARGLFIVLFFFKLISKKEYVINDDVHIFLNKLMWGTECLDVMFPLPTLICAGYSVKSIFLCVVVKIGKLTKNSTYYVTISTNYNILTLFLLCCLNIFPLILH